MNSSPSFDQPTIFFPVSAPLVRIHSIFHICNSQTHQRKNNSKSHFLPAIFFSIRKSVETHCVETWPKESCDRNRRVRLRRAIFNICIILRVCRVVRVINTNKHSVSNIFHIRHSHTPIRRNSWCHGCEMEKRRKNCNLHKL